MLSSCESFPSVASDTLDEVPCCRFHGIVGSATGVAGEEGNSELVLFLRHLQSISTGDTSGRNPPRYFI